MEKSKIGCSGYVNGNCWLARNLGRPPSKRCQYCQTKFKQCLFAKFLLVSLIFVIAILATSYILDKSISRSVIVSIFVLVIVYGRFFERSTESIIEANFAQSQSKDALEDLTKNLQQKVEDQTRTIASALSSEKGAREQAEALRVRDEAFLASIGDGVVAVDKKGKIIFINTVAEKLLGLDSGEALNKHYEDVLTTESEKEGLLPKEKNPLHFALDLGKRMVTDNSFGINTYRYVRKDKTKFPVSITVAPVVLGEEIIGAIDVFRDVTKEREIDRAKTEFISLASHQLKTPATIINLYAEKMLGGKLTAKQKESINEITIANHRMINIVDALLSVSKIESGGFFIQPKSQDIISILDKVIKDFEFKLKEKKIALKKEYHKDSFVLPVDEPLLHMIFNNLVSNAVKYTPEKRTIVVKSLEAKKGDMVDKKKMPQDALIISVSDEGYGIPRKQQSSIFTKFFRADNAHVIHADGTGLGLYIVKSILDYSGGCVWFASEENKGTTFFVGIPLTGMRQKEGEKPLVAK